MRSKYMEESYEMLRSNDADAASDAGSDTIQAQPMLTPPKTIASIAPESYSSSLPSYAAAEPHVSATTDNDNTGVDNINGDSTVDIEAQTQTSNPSFEDMKPGEQAAMACIGIPPVIVLFALFLILLAFGTGIFARILWWFLGVLNYCFHYFDAAVEQGDGVVQGLDAVVETGIPG